MKKKKTQRAIPFDITKTLEQLENSVWPPASGELITGLIRTCEKLRKIPVKNFTVENLRVMIGQQIGLKFLMPVALEVLKTNPLAQGDFYEGDLLQNVLRVPADFWQQYPYWQQDLAPIVDAAMNLIKHNIDTEGGNYEPVLAAIEKYQNNLSS